MSSGSSMAIALTTLAAVLIALVTMNLHFESRLQAANFIEVPAELATDEPLQATVAENALRVCADPNNLPFSNARGEGFENELARLMADAMGRTVSYTWWPQRRGFVRSTLGAHKCDLVMGVPTQMELLKTTAPYYRSSYVFVTRKRDRLDLHSLDDSRLRTLRIGLHTIGDDYSNVPPAQALASKGIIDNVRGYSIYGDYSQPDPPRRLIDAVANGEIDVAIAWGPLAGYFSRLQQVPLNVTLVDENSAELPVTFSISMGVRRGDEALQRDVEKVMVARKREIDAVLSKYGVPTLALKQQVMARSTGTSQPSPE
jgi:mxaJ protein